jgi:hypothetical protein
MASQSLGEMSRRPSLNCNFVFVERPQKLGARPIKKMLCAGAGMWGATAECFR